MRLTPSVLEAHANTKAILATPVLAMNDVPLAAFHVGQPTTWRWPSLGVEPPRQLCQNHPDRFGAVYLASNPDGLVKIGFGYEPVDRVAVQGLIPELFILVVQPRHERALHELFAEERRHSEFFSGDRVDSFIAFGRFRSRSTIDLWNPRGTRVSRAKMIDRALRRSDAREGYSDIQDKVA